MTHSLALSSRLFWSDLIKQFDLTQEEGLELFLELCFAPGFEICKEKGAFLVYVQFILFPLPKGWDVKVSWYRKGTFNLSDAEDFAEAFNSAMKIAQIQLSTSYAGNEVPEILAWMKEFSSKFNTRVSLLEALFEEK